MNDEKVLFYVYRDNQFFEANLKSTLKAIQASVKGENVCDYMKDEPELIDLLVNGKVDSNTKVLKTFCKETDSIIYVICWSKSGTGLEK